MEIEEAFGEVLRRFRMEQLLSQEELAHRCELDRTYIGLIERGKRKPTLNTIFALAYGLNVSASHLVLATENLLYK